MAEPNEEVGPVAAVPHSPGSLLARCYRTGPEPRKNVSPVLLKIVSPRIPDHTQKEGWHVSRLLALIGLEVNLLGRMVMAMDNATNRLSFP